jgi:MFS family permease
MQTLYLTDVQISGAGSAYLIGAAVGARFLGRLTDLLGRKKLFMITLGLFLGPQF